MAAIDPSEEVISDAAAHKPRATLKVITVPADMLDNDDEDEDDDDDLDDEDEEANGGPSEKTMKKIRDALAEESDGDSDEEMESEDEAEAQAVLAKLMKSTKGKSKALDEEDDDESDEDDEDLLGGELDECVVCTLDPEKVNKGRFCRVFYTNSALAIPTTSRLHHPCGRAHLLQGERYPHHPSDGQLCCAARRSRGR